ncbi:hypothetical protein GCA01S_002_00070 [Parageobacillus caldoxylosilyticus NBRC 107762]|jgi:hypothetical protein|uniref:Uncharacterized protein n=1 Tax=Parageobacillus caldoxylosilyticus NBRC 107762 TaxID=1220594 RepID=A0A023DA38_9BACL|nr:hypothetical protein [Parageobacillus caldoxylosilyticus]GAJ38219.1 hypothetical protein GCA01S_002_00070 [Parageobacillus caldoxylosilyticus NBRC 107762]
MGYIEELRALHRPVILVGALAIIKNEKMKYCCKSADNRMDIGDFLAD